MFELNELYNLDCMEAMREMPDKCFDLAIVDPPYGSGDDDEKKSVSNHTQWRRAVQALRSRIGGSRSGENSRLGRCAATRILRRVVQDIKKSNHMGWQLFQFAAGPMLHRVGQNEHHGTFFDGDVRIRVDEFQRQCQNC